VSIKINGSGFPSGTKIIMKASLPRNLKMAWPDRQNYSSVSYSDDFGFKPDISPVLRELNIRKYERILDIGAFKNEMVETLHDEGFHNAIGIDVNSKILKSRYGMQINFRDLPLKEKYRVIYFHQLLDHFPGGLFNNQPEPSLQLLADKIYIHLLPKGYLYFCDYAVNVPEFNKCLMNIGFKLIREKSKYDYIFQKG